MSNKPISRRNFLSGMFKTVTAGMLASILRFVPEAQGVLAAEGRLPKDTRVDRLTGVAAADAIAAALNARISKRLLSKLNANFAADTSNGMAVSASWSNTSGESYVMPVVVLPFKDGKGGEAYLFYSPIDEGAQSIMVDLKANRKALIEAKIYQVINGAITVNPVSSTAKGSPQPATHLCNQDCMIQCLQLYGCSGLSLTLCIAAIIACPFSIISCIGAWACTLYCGGAFSICWSNFCCANH